MKKNIGLVGRMHDGKSTVATILAEDYGYGVLHFATPVKELADKALTQIIDPYLRDISGKTMTPSKAMNLVWYQGVGSRGRAYDPDIWIKRMNMAFVKGGMGIVIDDMRYINEAAWAKVREFCIIRVLRPEVARLISIDDAFRSEHGREPDEWERQQILNHESETEVDDVPVDVTINNDRSIEVLREQVAWIMEDL